MLNNLTDLLIKEIKDLHSAEIQLLDALPKMEQAASHPELKTAFKEHLDETMEHVSRISEAGRLLGIDVGGVTCEAMKGLIKEGEELLQTLANPDVKDAALISAAQRIEHYEIAGYGSAKCFAHCAGHREVETLLDETLGEEKEADKKLTKIATGGLFGSGINQEATTR